MSKLSNNKAPVRLVVNEFCTASTETMKRRGTAFVKKILSSLVTESAPCSGPTPSVDIRRTLVLKHFSFSEGCESEVKYVGREMATRIGNKRKIFHPAHIIR